MMKKDVVLRSALSDILKGFTIYKGGGEVIYVKHMTPDDHVDMEEVYENYYNTLRRKGVSTSEEILKGLRSSGLWSDKEERLIESLQEEIDNLQDTRDRSITQQDIKQVEEILKKQSMELYLLLEKKNSFLSTSCEYMADRKVHEYYALGSLYKNSCFSEPYFSKDEIDDLDFNVKKYTEIQEKSIKKCSAENIKKISIMDSFRASYSLAKDAYQFYGKPISKLTYFQSSLAQYTEYYNSIFEHYPDLTKETDPEKITQKFKKIREMERSGAKAKNKGGVHHIGATESDYRNLNQTAPDRQKLFEEAGKKGKARPFA